MFFQDESFDILGATSRTLRRRCAAELTSIGKWLWAVQDPGGRRFIIGAWCTGSRAKPEYTTGSAMVGISAADDLVSAGFAVAMLVGSGDFERRFGKLECTPISLRILVC